MNDWSETPSNPEEPSGWFQIHWRSLENDDEHHGTPFFSRKADAESVVSSLNQRYRGRLKHWLESIPVKDKETP